MKIRWKLLFRALVAGLGSRCSRVIASESQSAAGAIRRSWCDPIVHLSTPAPEAYPSNKSEMDNGEG